MLPSYALFYITIMFIVNIVASQNVHIIPDGTPWIDNYAIDSNGVTGWSYPSDASPTPGNGKSYHGWYYQIFTRQYAGYFYRRFQCQYDSTITVTFNAYFACRYNELQDGGILYINENKFQFVLNDNTNTFFNITAADQTVIDQASSCTIDSDKLRGVTPNINTSLIQVAEYTTFDIGFTMINMDGVLTSEFAAISDIQITCNKIDQQATTPNPEPQTPAPTIISINQPIGHTACSNMSDNGQCNAATECGYTTQCLCNDGQGVDIIFGIYGEFLNDDQTEIKNWFHSDVFPNINPTKSRVGMISFANDVETELTVGYHSRLDIENAFNAVTWRSGWLDFPGMFDAVISQFDSISTDKNVQQILIIVVDDDPREPPTGEYIPICQYRNAFASRGIRAIPIVINALSNTPQLANYDCIIQNTWDAILTTHSAGVTYTIMNNEVTDQLSAALCPNDLGTSNPSESPTLYPTKTPTETPSKTPTKTPSETPSETPSKTPTTTPSESPVKTQTTYSTQPPTDSPSKKPTLRPTEAGDDRLNITIIVDDKSDITIPNIIAVVANTTGLAKEQIQVIRDSNDNTKLYVYITGPEAEIDEIDVDNIDKDLGNDVRISTVSRSSDKTKNNNDIKDLLIILIVSICILTFVILIISFVCCYCFYKRKKTKVALKKGVELGFDNSKHLNKRQSVPSASVPIVPIEQPETPLQNILNTNSGQWDNTPPESPVITTGHISNYSGDNNDTTNNKQPEILRVQTEGDIHSVILNMNSTRTSGGPGDLGDGLHISTGVVNDLLDEELDEEEVNKMYFKKSEELAPRIRDETMTKTGENNVVITPKNADEYETPGYGPNIMDKQISIMSLATPKMSGINSINNAGHITPINLSPNHSPLHMSKNYSNQSNHSNNNSIVLIPQFDLQASISQNIQNEIMQNELSNNLPLPNEQEDDDIVVKDIKNETNENKKQTVGEMSDEYIVSPDSNEEYEKMYDKPKGNTKQLPEENKNENENSENKNDIDAMYEKNNNNNNTKGNNE